MRYAKLSVTVRTALTTSACTSNISAKMAATSVS